MGFRAVTGAVWLVVVTAGACAPGPASSQPVGGSAHAEVHAARLLAGRDPPAALARLQAIKRRAPGDALALRFEADEAQCRILSDSDPKLARQYAEAATVVAVPVGRDAAGRLRRRRAARPWRARPRHARTECTDRAGGARPRAGRSRRDGHAGARAAPLARRRSGDRPGRPAACVHRSAGARTGARP